MDPRRRVKVYLLEEEDRWVDKGTGHISLPEHAIRGEISYGRQDETLIVWTEPSGEDWAVSFQEAEGCKQIWDMLQEILGKCSTDNRDDLLDDGLAGQPPNQHLPEPTIANLDVIRDVICRIVRTKHGRDRVAHFIVSSVREARILSFNAKSHSPLPCQDYLFKLSVVFHKLEDLDAVEDLAILFDIAKCIVLTGDPELYLTIVRDEFFVDTLGMLEYDPTVRGLPGTFRTFVREHVRHVQVLETMDDGFRTIVTQAYRLQYLKDVVIARYLDDPVFNNLSDAIRGLYAKILRTLVHSQSFVDELVRIFAAGHKNGPHADVPDDSERRRNAALFLKELSAVTKQCLEIRAQEVYNYLYSMGLFRVVRFGLSDDRIETRQATAEFLAAAMDVDRKLVQAFCLGMHRQHGTSLVHVLIDRLLQETDQGLLQQCVETLKLLLEPEALPLPGALLSEAGGVQLRPVITPEYDEFLDMFYSSCAAQLLVPMQRAVRRGTLAYVTVADTTLPVLTLPNAEVERLYQLLELLHLMLRTHSKRFRQLLSEDRPMAGQPGAPWADAKASPGKLTKDLDLAGILKHVALCKHKHVQLATLRILRTMVVQSDVVYARYIVRNQLLHAVIYVLLLTDAKYNLVNSVALELLETIANRAFGTTSGPSSVGDGIVVGSLSAAGIGGMGGLGGVGGIGGAGLLGSVGPAPAQAKMLMHHVAGMRRYWPHLEYASRILERFRRDDVDDDDLDILETVPTDSVVSANNEVTEKGLRDTGMTPSSTAGPVVPSLAGPEKSATSLESSALRDLDEDRSKEQSEGSNEEDIPPEPLPSPAMDSRARVAARSRSNSLSPSPPLVSTSSTTPSGLAIGSGDRPPIRLLPLARYCDDDEGDDKGDGNGSDGDSNKKRSRNIAGDLGGLILHGPASASSSQNNNGGGVATTSSGKLGGWMSRRATTTSGASGSGALGPKKTLSFKSKKPEANSSGVGSPSSPAVKKLKLSLSDMDASSPVKL